MVEGGKCFSETAFKTSLSASHDGHEAVSSFAGVGPH